MSGKFVFGLGVGLGLSFFPKPVFLSHDQFYFSFFSYCKYITLGNHLSKSFLSDTIFLFLCVILSVSLSRINFINYTICFPSCITNLRLKMCSFCGVCRFLRIERNAFSICNKWMGYGFLSPPNVFSSRLFCLHTSQNTVVAFNIQYKAFSVKWICLVLFEWILVVIWFSRLVILVNRPKQLRLILQKWVFFSILILPISHFNFSPAFSKQLFDLMSF